MVCLYASILAKAIGLFTVTGSYQYDPCTASPSCTPDILQAVPDHASPGQIQPVIGLCLVDQSGFWFTAIAAIFRDMRAIINSLYAAAVISHGVCHLLMDFLEPRRGNYSSIYYRLIGDHNYVIAIDG